MARMDQLVLPEPFAYSVSPYEHAFLRFCNNCLKELDHSEASSVKRCEGCKFAHYCDDSCLESSRECHNLECKRLQNFFPNLPTGSTLLYARIIDKLNACSISISDERPWNDYKTRTWENLESHIVKIRSAEWRKVQFSEMKVLLERFFAQDLSLLPTEDDLWFIFAKKIINSNVICDKNGNMIGESVDLQGSAFDHSCRPTLAILFDGKTTVFQSLIPDEPITPANSFVSYVDLAMSKRQRRQQLQQRYYFTCQCKRCLDPKDDLLTSLCCPDSTCTGTIVITEDETITTQKTCPLCSATILADQLKIAQSLMNNCGALVAELESAFSKNSREGFRQSEKAVETYRRFMSAENVYLADISRMFIQKALKYQEHLQTALDLAIAMAKCMRLCYPPNHKKLAYHLATVLRLQLLTGTYPSVWFLKETQNIFMTWFGVNHQNVKALTRLSDDLQEADEICESVRQKLLDQLKLE